MLDKLTAVEFTNSKVIPLLIIGLRMLVIAKAHKIQLGMLCGEIDDIIEIFLIEKIDQDVLVVVVSVE